MRRRRLLWQIYPSYLLITIISLLTVVWYASNSFKKYIFEQTEEGLRGKAKMLESQFSNQQILSDSETVDALCKKSGRAGGIRVTVILPSGKVIGDTNQNPAVMENHANRPEIVEAIAGKVGTSIRDSTTLQKKMMYVAIPLMRTGRIVGVLRTSVPITLIGQSLNKIRIRLFLQWGIIAIVAAVISLFIVRRVIRPLNQMRKGAERFAQGDLAHQLSVPHSEEIGGLAESLNQMACQLNDRIETIVKLENVRSDFVANVSHELKTPITTIKGSVETLLDEAFHLSDDAKRFLRIIARHTDRLSAITDDLLTLARVEEENEKRKLLFKKNPLKEILDLAVEDCEQQILEKNIKISLDCQQGLQVKANAPLLQQAIVNLISNAIKYSPADSPIAIDAQQFDSNVRIQVKDQGCGIAANHLPRLFERFYRVDPARSRKLGGTGLGLAIVRHIIQAHEGWIEVESKLEQGSTFSIFLPK